MTADPAMSKVYTWEYRIKVPPYERIVDVLEAFFASYPAGDYTCEKRETYRLRFRRGQWRRRLLGMGELVPDALAKGRFERWPIVLYVLVRPSPETFLITVRYELHLPKSVPTLISEVQSSVNEHCLKELRDLAAYLAECIQLDEAPAIVEVK